MPTLLDKYSDKNDKNKYNEFCDTRKCLLYSENEEKPLAYSYICNFDSSKDFSEKSNTIYKRVTSNNNEITSNTYIQCNKIKTFSTSNTLIVNYIYLCDQNVLYKCELFEKPNEKDCDSYNMKETCPGVNYTKTSFLLGISFLLIDIICYIFLFLIEYLILKKMLYTTIAPTSRTHRR
jgi:hypothetical protein